MKKKNQKTIKLKTFGDKLCEVLREKKISQKKLSEITGIARPVISRWVQDRFKPSIDNLVLLSNTLDKPIYYFVEKARAIPREKMIKVEGNNNITSSNVIGSTEEIIIIKKDIEILKEKIENLELINKLRERK